MSEWVPVKWKRAEDLATKTFDPIVIELTETPFYDGHRFAVRCRSQCLNVGGRWEWEPQPSSRDDAFYARCRFLNREVAIIVTERALTRSVDGPGIQVRSKRAPNTPVPFDSAQGGPGTGGDPC